MLFKVTLVCLLVSLEVHSDILYGCLLRPEICNPIHQHCLNDGHFGICVKSHHFHNRDIQSSLYEPVNQQQQNTATDGEYGLPSEKRRELASIVLKVKRLLHARNIELSDLSVPELDQLAKAVAELYLQQKKDTARKRLKLETLLKDAGRSDLANLVSANKIKELRNLLFSSPDPSIVKNSRTTLSKNRQIESIENETKGRKPQLLTSSAAVANRVGGRRDNSSDTTTPDEDPPQFDAFQSDSLMDQSENDGDPIEADPSSPEKFQDGGKLADMGKRSGSPSNDVESTKASIRSSRPSSKEATYIIVIVVLVVVVLCIVVIALVLYYMKSAEARGKLLGASSVQSGDDYQALCRQHYASNTGSKPGSRQPLVSKAAQGSTRRVFSPSYPTTNKPSRNSSQSSWSEEPITTTLDISTGHTVLAYMEDHLNNKDRLDKEWEDLCAYKADGVTTKAAEENAPRNRSQSAVPYDHNRVKLNAQTDAGESDYINASTIIDNDPRYPVYIACQGPLSSTIHHFWQMIWEQGCVVIVMLTPRIEEGVSQCARYWPDEYSSTYNDYEIHLVSEHVWCDDYLVRSLYLKNLKSNETRTITQFNFLSWPVDGVPPSSKQLLELRRKVSKCYRGNALSPIVVHCSDGCGRTGSYMLLDMVISRMAKGTSKEIDIAATLEHLRDQRAGPLVANKSQFEFVLACVADEVNAILKVLLQ